MGFMNSQHISTNNITLGFICSSGGSVLDTCWPLFKELGISIVIITDRECGVESKFKGRDGCIVERITYVDKTYFSSKCRDFFLQHKVNGFIGLYFTRFVGEEIYKNWNVVNFHPTLLPLFPGLGSKKKLIDSGSKMVGATAHLVDGTCDGGAIIAQISNASQVHHWDKMLYLQKVYLLLAVLEKQLNSDLQATDSTDASDTYMNAYPRLCMKQVASFLNDIQKNEKINFLAEA